MTNLSTPVEYFKKEAKKLFRQVQANDADALARVQRVLNDPTEISLMRIQHVVAIEYGFSKWEDLIMTSAVELQSAITRTKPSSHRSNTLPNRTGTPLGNFLRGPGIIPTPPHLTALADMFDKMSMDEQRRYLDEDARAMGLFDRR
jgi:hypothetical protein